MCPTTNSLSSTRSYKSGPRAGRLACRSVRSSRECRNRHSQPEGRSGLRKLSSTQCRHVSEGALRVSDQLEPVDEPHRRISFRSVWRTYRPFLPGTRFTDSENRRLKFLKALSRAKMDTPNRPQRCAFATSRLNGVTSELRYQIAKSAQLGSSLTH